MVFRLFHAPFPEPSRAIGFGGNIIERLSEHRLDDAIETALVNPATRFLIMDGGSLALKRSGASSDPYFSADDAIVIGATMATAVLLGSDAFGPVLAVPAIWPEAMPQGVSAVDYRSAAMQGLIDPAALGALAQGAALLAWHANHGFCGKCGGATQMRGGGVKRLCLACGAEHFPRTDPVAIMLAARRDHCLLGRGKHFATGMYSALAGFVEHGETLEDAVRRETFEESGIRLGRVTYYASQPWPFPYSLMIGCFGEALNEDIAADKDELEDVRWFSRAEVETMIAKSHPDGLVVPPGGAIATHLIRAWAESAAASPASPEYSE